MVDYDNTAEMYFQSQFRWQECCVVLPFILLKTTYPWLGEGSPDVKAVDVDLGAAPVDWTVGICQTPERSWVTWFLDLDHVDGEGIDNADNFYDGGIPIERCTAFVLDPEVGEGENAVAALNDDSDDTKQSQYHKH